MLSHNLKKVFLFLAVIVCSIFCQSDITVSIHQELLGISLQGTWLKTEIYSSFLGVLDYKQQNAQTSTFVSFFPTSSGKAQVLITKALKKTQQDKSQLSVHIQLINNKYINGQVVQFTFQISKGYNKTLNQWKTPKFYTPARLFKNMKHVVTLGIELSFQMKRNFKNQTQIILKSDSLNIEMALNPYNYGLSYFILFTIINGIQISLLLVSRKNQVTLANTSQWLIIQTCCFIVVETFFLIKLGLGYFDTKLSWLSLNVLTNILVMMLILRKFQVVLEKFRNMFKFLLAVAFIFCYSVAVYKFYANPMFWILQSMIFLWQIGYSISRGGSGGVSMQLVLVVLLSRIPLLAQMKSEDNALKLKPDNMAANFIIVCMVIHLIILALQRRFGGRFFTPKSIIPDYFDYLRQAFYCSQIAREDCSICLNKLRNNPGSKEEDNQEADSPEKIQFYKNKKISYVSTPCRHNFHQKCLSDWMNSHLVCPLDKRGLPPMNVGGH